MKVQKLLTPEESDRLDGLEKTIRRGMKCFVETGEALREVRDSGLYRCGFKTFEQYCREKWGWQRQRAYELIAASEVAKSLPESCNKFITSDHQARELAKVPEAQREEVIKKASEGGKLTAKSISQAAAETEEEESATAVEASHQPEEPAAHEVLATLKVEPAVTEYYAKLESVMLDAIANATDKQLKSMSVYAALLPKLIKDELRRRGAK